MSKGELTRSRILDQAVVLASRLGLEGLTLGVLADALHLSKSGLYAHFRSKEALILAVLEHTRSRHLEHLSPYLEGKAKGLAEFRAFFASWLDWTALPSLPAGCPILGASFELEDVPGPPRDYVIETMRASRVRLTTMLKAAVANGELDSNLPIDQVLFETRGIVLSFHLEYRLLGEKHARARADHAFEQLLARYANTKAQKTSGA
jgi:AcrR family transcriptional regulator